MTSNESSSGMRILIACFTAKLVWDLITISQTWPDFSRPKFGIAVVLPILLIGLWKNKQWAINLSGVVCTFWIVFVFARLIGPMFMIEKTKVPFPWSNLIAFPAFVFILNNLKTDEEMRAARTQGDVSIPAESSKQPG